MTVPLVPFTDGVPATDNGGEMLTVAPNPQLTGLGGALAKAGEPRLATLAIGMASATTPSRILFLLRMSVHPLGQDRLMRSSFRSLHAPGTHAPGTGCLADSRRLRRLITHTHARPPTTAVACLSSRMGAVFGSSVVAPGARR